MLRGKTDCVGRSEVVCVRYYIHPCGVQVIRFPHHTTFIPISLDLPILRDKDCLKVIMQDFSESRFYDHRCNFKRLFA